MRITVVGVLLIFAGVIVGALLVGALNKTGNVTNNQQDGTPKPPVPWLPQDGTDE